VARVLQGLHNVLHTLHGAELYDILGHDIVRPQMAHLGVGLLLEERHVLQAHVGVVNALVEEVSNTLGHQEGDHEQW